MCLFKKKCYSFLLIYRFLLHLSFPYSLSVDEPSLLTRYAMDLAAAFHGFYAACKVNSEDKELTDARLKLCDTVRIALGNVLTLLSISAPEQM